MMWLKNDGCYHFIYRYDDIFIFIEAYRCVVLCIAVICCHSYVSRRWMCMHIKYIFFIKIGNSKAGERYPCEWEWKFGSEREGKKIIIMWVYIGLYYVCAQHKCLQSNLYIYQYDPIWQWATSIIFNAVSYLKYEVIYFLLLQSLHFC